MAHPTDDDNMEYELRSETLEDLLLEGLKRSPDAMVPEEDLFARVFDYEPITTVQGQIYTDSTFENMEPPSFVSASPFTNLLRNQNTSRRTLSSPPVFQQLQASEEFKQPHHRVSSTSIIDHPLRRKSPNSITPKPLRFHDLSDSSNHTDTPTMITNPEAANRRNSSPVDNLFLNTNGIKKKRKSGNSPVTSGEDRRHSISYTPLEKYRIRTKKTGASVCFENNEFVQFSSGTHETQQSNKPKEDSRKMRFTVVQFE